MLISNLVTFFCLVVTFATFVTQLLLSMGVLLQERKLKTGGKSYYLTINTNGGRAYEFLGITINKNDTAQQRKEKKLIADSIRSQRELDLISDGTAYKPQHRQKVDFIAFCESYLSTYDKKDKRMVKYAIEKFDSFLVDRKYVQNSKKFTAVKLTPIVCEDFKNYLQSTDAGLSGETPQNYFSRFKKVVKYATQKGVLKQNPCIDIRFKKSKESDTLKKNVLTTNELKVLFNTPCGNAEVKRAFLFACFSGLGIAEIRKLKWSNIQNGKLITKREKTGTKVNILLSKNAIHLLGEKKIKSEPVFDLNISDTAINKNLRNWIEKAEIEKHLSFYCGRHTYAVLLLQEGANLKTVSDAMAHLSTSHTIKYLTYVDSLKDKATSNMKSII